MLPQKTFPKCVQDRAKPSIPGPIGWPMPTQASHGWQRQVPTATRLDPVKACLGAIAKLVQGIGDLWRCSASTEKQTKQTLNQSLQTNPGSGFVDNSCSKNCGRECGVELVADIRGCTVDIYFETLWSGCFSRVKTALNLRAAHVRNLSTTAFGISSPDCETVSWMKTWIRVPRSALCSPPSARLAPRQSAPRQSAGSPWCCPNSMAPRPTR